MTTQRSSPLVERIRKIFNSDKPLTDLHDETMTWQLLDATQLRLANPNGAASTFRRLD